MKEKEWNTYNSMWCCLQVKYVGSKSKSLVIYTCSRKETSPPFTSCSSLPLAPHTHTKHALTHTQTHYLKPPVFSFLRFLEVSSEKVNLCHTTVEVCAASEFGVTKRKVFTIWALLVSSRRGLVTNTLCCHSHDNTTHKYHLKTVEKAFKKVIFFFTFL